jgi:hypothetical protein
MRNTKSGRNPADRHLVSRRSATRVAALALAAAATVHSAASAQSTWIGTSNGTTLWSDSSAWQGGTLPSGSAGATLNFYPSTAIGPAAGATVTALNDFADPFTLNVLNLRGTTVGGGLEGVIVIANDRNGANGVIGNGLVFDGAGAQISVAPGYGTGSGTTYRITAPITFNTDTTLTFNNTGGNLALNSFFMGSGRLTITNLAANRIVRLNGESAIPGSALYTGNVNVTQGVVALGAKSNILGTNATGTQTVTIAAGAQVQLDYNNAAYGQPQNFVLSGAATPATGANGTAALRSGSINFGNAGIGGVALAGNSSINVTATVPQTRALGVNGQVVGSGNLTIEGNSQLILNATSTGATWNGVSYGAYSGNVYVGTGTSLRIANKHDVLGSNGGAGNIGGQTVTAAPGASINFNDGNGAYNSYQNFVLNGGGYGTLATLQIDGVNNFFYSGTGHQLGRIVLASGSSTISVNRDGTNDRLPNGASLAGSVLGSGDFTKLGAAPLYLNATSNPLTLDGVSYGAFSGNATISAGWVVFGKANGLLGPNGTAAAPGSQAIVVNAGASAYLAPGNAAYTANQYFVLNGTGVAQTVGANSISLAALQLDGVNGFGGNGYAIGGLAIASDTTISLNRDGSANAVSGLVVNGTVVGAGNLTKVGLAPLYLSKSSDTRTLAGTDYAPFSGNVAVNAGWLQLGPAHNILGPNGTLAAPGAQTVTVASGASVVLNDANGAYASNQNFVLNGAGYSQTIGTTTTSFATLQLNNLNFGDHRIAKLGAATDATVSINLNGTPDQPTRGLRTTGLAGAGRITLTGTGRLYVDGPAAAIGAVSSFSGTVVTASAGLVVGNADAFGVGGLSVGNGSASLTSGLPKGVTVSSLAFTGTGQLQLNNNAVVVKYTGTSPIDAVRAAIASATPGIVTSLSSTNPAVAVGYGQASAIGAANGTYRGVAIGADALVIVPALYGDATLDGTVNFDDLLKLAANYNSTGYWTGGDFTYDGTVNFDDLLKLAANYNTTLSGSFAGDWALAQAAVPEPMSAAAVVAVAACGLARRRRR